MKKEIQHLYAMPPDVLTEARAAIRQVSKHM
jgi:hypothetical protein